MGTGRYPDCTRCQGCTFVGFAGSRNGGWQLTVIEGAVCPNAYRGNDESSPFWGAEHGFHWFTSFPPIFFAQMPEGFEKINFKEMSTDEKQMEAKARTEATGEAHPG